MGAIPNNYPPQLLLDSNIMCPWLGTYSDLVFFLGVGCVVETHKIAGNNMYMLRILPKMNSAGSGRPALEVATENLEDILDWQTQIEGARNAIETQQHVLIKREQVLKQQSRNKRIALEMSDLVLYCRPVPFTLESKGLFFF